MPVAVADQISDERVVSALRAFVRGCDPMLPRLRDIEIGVAPTDPEVDHRRLRRLRQRIAVVRWPGSASWARMSVADRSAWWINRVGRLTALAASVTGLAGALGDYLPLQDIMGAAGQGLLLCAIAGEHGVADEDTRIRLLGAVLFGRDLTPTSAGPVPEPAPEPPPRRPVNLKRAAKWLWHQGRLLLAVSDELAKRPRGRFYHRMLGKLPVVGMAGDYLAERAALKRAAKAADRWLRIPPFADPEKRYR
jgi:hypothetical protein